MSVHLEAKARPLWDPPIMARAAVDSVRKLNPVHQVKNPVMLIVEVGALLTTLLAVQALLGQGEAPAGFIVAISAWLWFTVIFANFAEAMAEGRGKAQADNLRKARRDVTAKKLSSPNHGAAYTADTGRHAAAQRRRAGRGRRRHSRRRRGDRRRGLGRRERHYRRKRAGHPRKRRRPQRGDRRHTRAVGLAGRADHRQPGRGIPRPHDCHGRGRQAPEDAERDRAEHLAVGVDHHLPAGDGHAAALFDLRRRRHRPGAPCHRHGAGRAAGLPHPDDDRRPAVGDRHRRHGPHDPGERHRRLGTGRRSGRRRRRAAAGQDGDDHAGQPAGDGVRAGPGCFARTAGGCRPACLAGRRNAGGTQHRRAGQGSLQPARARRTRAWAPISSRLRRRPA